ncbi:MAG: YncE family protein [Planctomycetota bacterium]
MQRFLIPLVLGALAWFSPRLQAEGLLLVLNKTDATLSFVDPANSTVLAVIGTGIGPHEIAVEPGGARAVVSNYGAGRSGSSLTVVDLAKRIPIDTLDLGSHRRPHGIAFRSAGRVLVTCEETHALLEVDLKSRSVAREIKTDQEIAHMVVVAPDGKRAFVANIRSGSISVFDLEAGTLLQSLATGAGAEGIAITPDGGEVWVANREADTLAVVDAKTLKVSATLPCASFPIRVQITPDGLRALVSNAKSGEVAVFDVHARKELARLSLAVTPVERQDERLFGAEFKGSPAPVGILIDPSGKRAFIANTSADVISVLDLEQLALSGRLRAGREPDGLGWIQR